MKATVHLLPFFTGDAHAKVPLVLEFSNTLEAARDEALAHVFNACNGFLPDFKWEHRSLSVGDVVVFSDLNNAVQDVGFVCFPFGWGQMKAGDLEALAALDFSGRHEWVMQNHRS